MPPRPREQPAPRAAQRPRTPPLAASAAPPPLADPGRRLCSLHSGFSGRLGARSSCPPHCPLRGEGQAWRASPQREGASPVFPSVQPRTRGQSRGRVPLSRGRRLSLEGCGLCAPRAPHARSPALSGLSRWLKISTLHNQTPPETCRGVAGGGLSGRGPLAQPPAPRPPKPRERLSGPWRGPGTGLEPLGGAPLGASLSAEAPAPPAACVPSQPVQGADSAFPVAFRLLLGRCTRPGALEWQVLGWVGVA